MLRVGEVRLVPNALALPSARKPAAAQHRIHRAWLACEVMSRRPSRPLHRGIDRRASRPQRSRRPPVVLLDGDVQHSTRLVVSQCSAVASHFFRTGTCSHSAGGMAPLVSVSIASARASPGRLSPRQRMSKCVRLMPSFSAASSRVIPDASIQRERLVSCFRGLPGDRLAPDAML
jgi:hypothetical protein